MIFAPDARVLTRDARADAAAEPAFGMGVGAFSARDWSGCFA
jgi:hypothetical protein